MTNPLPPLHTALIDRLKRQVTTGWSPDQHCEPVRINAYQPGPAPAAGSCWPVFPGIKRTRINPFKTTIP